MHINFVIAVGEISFPKLQRGRSECQLASMCVANFWVFSYLCVQAATHCLTNAECGTDECCFKHDGPFLVSKRKRASSDLLGPAMHSSTGLYYTPRIRKTSYILLNYLMVESIFNKVWLFSVHLRWLKKKTTKLSSIIYKRFT